MESGIYKITCLKNNKNYIGSAIWINKRLSRHRIDLKNGISRNPHMQNAYNLYGKESFVFQTVENCDKESLVNREQFWIDFYKAANREFGFNIIPHADRREVSEETKLKISLGNKGKKRTPEQLEKYKIAQNNRDSEWNEKISQGLQGRVLAEASRLKMSESKKKLFASGFIHPAKGKKLTDKQKENISKKVKLRYKNGYINPCRGIKLSEDRIEKMKEASLKRYIDGFDNPNKKKCYCVETGLEFDSFKIAAERNGLHQTEVSRSVRSGKQVSKNKCLTFRIKE